MKILKNDTPSVNAFCPRGRGNGVDPNCSPKGKSKSTKGIKIDSFATIVDRYTSLSGGPGETPVLELDINGKTWKWFAEPVDEDILYIPRGEIVQVTAHGYEEPSRD